MFTRSEREFANLKFRSWFLTGGARVSAGVEQPAAAASYLCQWIFPFHFIFPRHLGRHSLVGVELLGAELSKVADGNVAAGAQSIEAESMSSEKDVPSEVIPLAIN
jgi:hypothetical protein